MAVYDLYHVGEEDNRHHGMTVAFDQSLNAQFRKISDSRKNRKEK